MPRWCVRGAARAPPIGPVAVESGCIVHVAVQVTEDGRIGGQYGDAGHLRGTRAQSSA